MEAASNQWGENVIPVVEAVAADRTHCQECEDWRHSPTIRERGVLALVAQGYTNERVAKALGLTDKTVRSHMTSIMTKLDTPDRTSSVMVALQAGWIRVVDAYL